MDPITLPDEIHFGVNITDKMLDWWYTSYLPNTFYPTYGDEAEVLVVLLDPAKQLAARLNWQSPLATAAHVLATGTGDRYDGPMGLLRNVAGKLGFVLCYGIDSIEAEVNPHLVLPRPAPPAMATCQRAGAGTAYMRTAHAARPVCGLFSFCG